MGTYMYKPRPLHFSVKVIVHSTYLRVQRGKKEWNDMRGYMAAPQVELLAQYYIQHCCREGGYQFVNFILVSSPYVCLG